MALLPALKTTTDPRNQKENIAAVSAWFSHFSSKATKNIVSKNVFRVRTKAALVSFETPRVGGEPFHPPHSYLVVVRDSMTQFAFFNAHPKHVICISHRRCF